MTRRAARWDRSGTTAAAASPSTSEQERDPGLGLALSGGGFRAAFFHLGVLARLAERGLLRKVEVISTVSGGSIVGAALYLHLKSLLETFADSEITDRHYVEIVEHMEETFLEGVQRHVRAEAYGDLRKNFRMARATYSRSDRLGEVYDAFFYRPAWEAPLFGKPAARHPDAGEMIELRELLIAPKGSPAGFDPRRDNPGRKALVPILVVNATSLNTGHNWRFEAVRMGEDPRLRRRWLEIDRNMRLERARWEDLAEHQRSFELGTAVAASSCVPGLFHPLAVSDLFRYRLGEKERDLRVQLVDGGVHDNQGVCGLIDAGCTSMIVSDASGQMSDQDDPPTRIPATVTRSTSGVYGDRVREEQLVGVLEHHQPAALVHLRKGLPSLIVPPVQRKGDTVEPDPRPGSSYRVDEGVQLLLSGVRTDLDSFSQIEAYSLMAFGYEQALVDVDGSEIGRAAAGNTAGTWRFAGMRRHLERAKGRHVPHLEAALKRFGKAFRLSRAAKVKGALAALAGVVVAGAIVAGVVWLLRRFLAGDVPGWATVVSVLAAAILTGALVYLYLGSFGPTSIRGRLAELLYGRLSPVLLALPLWVAAKLMLWLHHDFLEAGRLETLED